MALSVQSRPGGSFWPLGCIVVPTPGNKVCLMFNVDPSNNNAPETYNGPGGTPGLAYTPAAHQIVFQGVHPGANNNGMVLNTGPMYISTYPQGNGAGNRSDSGCMLMVVYPGSGAQTLALPMEGDTISPYQLFVDADNANDGLLAFMVI